MSYTNVAIFREKGPKSFSSLTSEFYEKMGQKKIIVDFFYWHLIQN
jgi:hypothetical protein